MSEPATWSDLAAVPVSHSVTWTIQDDNIRGEITCSDVSRSAACHHYCADGCEIFPCEHQPKRQMTCNIRDWLMDGRLEEFYGGPETSVRDGLINVEWDGDCYLWHYADEQQP